MEAFFSTLAQYVDFLVLGFVAVPILTAPFDFEPLLLGWSSLHHAAPDNNYFRHLLIGGVFFAVSYFSGYALIAIGHQLVQDAHVQIVYEAQKPFDKDIAIPQPDWRFKLRAIPFFGVPLGPSEITAYRDDARYQVYWIICDNTSYENVLAGPTLKEQRLLIGAPP
jgi:hypothetical protein